MQRWQIKEYKSKFSAISEENEALVHSCLATTKRVSEKIKLHFQSNKKQETIISEKDSHLLKSEDCFGAHIEFLERTEWRNWSVKLKLAEANKKGLQYD